MKLKRIKNNLIYILFSLLGGLLLLLYEFRHAINLAYDAGSWDPITEVSKLRFRLFSLTQTFCIIFTVIPGTPIQIIAAISLGRVLAFLACRRNRFETSPSSSFSKDRFQIELYANRASGNRRALSAADKIFHLVHHFSLYDSRLSIWFNRLHSGESENALPALFPADDTRGHA